MKLTLLKGGDHRSTLPHPTIYKCKIKRQSGNLVHVVAYIGPLHLVPDGWHVMMYKSI